MMKTISLKNTITANQYIQIQSLYRCTKIIINNYNTLENPGESQMFRTNRGQPENGPAETISCITVLVYSLWSQSLG